MATRLPAPLRPPAPIDEPWIEDALCAEVDPKIFFPERGEPVDEAKRICGRCDVREDCLRWALDHEEEHGVWGGTSGRQRAMILDGRAPSPLAA